jgi:histidyl-tRNA synthetase
MKNVVPSVKGTRDFYPSEMAARSWLYQTIRGVSEAFGYQEYEGPFLERIDLYAAKSGDELVNQQSFVFQDRGGDPITLRPELTPTLARMVAQRQNELVFPLRWWSFGPFWRYERPQKGRTREFFQWNIDAIGVNSPEADGELLAVCARFFQAVGLDSAKVKILVNSRRLMDEQLAAIGVSSAQKRVAFQAIDRRDKLPPADWRDYALGEGLTPGQVDGIVKILADQETWKKSDELRRVFALMERIGLADYFQYAPYIIRGLDYYTGIVFEAKDLEGGRSILGGGHYDNLVAAVGGDPLPGVGFAMGDVMIGIILEKYGLLPELARTPAEVLVTVFDEGSILETFALAQQLRSQGLKVACYPEPVKLPKQFKYADRMGIHFAAVLGPDEKASGMVTIKDLSQRSQETVAVEQAGEAIRALLAGPAGL